MKKFAGTMIRCSACARARAGSLAFPCMQGAPNIDDFLPDKEAIIDYRALGSPAALRAELLRLGSDAAAWNAKVDPWAGRLYKQAPDLHLLPRLSVDNRGVSSI